MSEFSPKKLNKSDVNGGNEFENRSILSPSDVNAMVKGILYNNENGGGSTGGVDVKIDNVSITENGIANIPLSSRTNAGVVKTATFYGAWVETNVPDQIGALKIASASKKEIGERHAYPNRLETLHKPITPSNLDFAIKEGITTNNITLTGDEKAKIREWIGIPFIHKIFMDLYDENEKNYQVLFTVPLSVSEPITLENVESYSDYLAGAVGGVIHSDASLEKSMPMSISFVSPDGFTISTNGANKAYSINSIEDTVL